MIKSEYIDHLRKMVEYWSKRLQKAQSDTKSTQYAICKVMYDAYKTVHDYEDDVSIEGEQ